MTVQQQAARGAKTEWRRGDLSYILLRHKWKIVFLSLMGFAAAGYVLAFDPLPWAPPGTGEYLETRYESTAKVLIKTSSERRTADGGVDSVGVGHTLMLTEAEILSSADLATEAAQRMNVDLLKQLAGENSYSVSQVAAAARTISRGMRSGIIEGSTVIQVKFVHRERDLVQPVLGVVIQAYLNKHLSVRQDTTGFEADLKRQTAELQAELQELEFRLKAAKSRAKVVTLEDTKKDMSQLLSKLREEIFNAETELTIASNNLAVLAPNRSNAPKGGLSGVVQSSVPEAALTDYRRAAGQIETLLQKEQSALLVYTPESVMVRSIREQISEAQAARVRLEQEYPGLSASAPAPEAEDSGEGLKALNELTLIQSLTTKLARLRERHKQVEEDAEALSQAELEIAGLQREKELKESQYRYFKANLEQARIDGRLAALRQASVGVVQQPSAATVTPNQRNQVAAALALGGLFLGVGLAFFLERVFDRSVRRSADVEEHLSTPLFAAIPKLRLNGYAKALGTGTQRALAPGVQGAGQSGERKTTRQPAVARRRHPLEAFADSLRERLFNHFEGRGLLEAPKLVGVTSCAEGSGVSVVAASLALSLAESGEGSVLLVEIDAQKGLMGRFSKGQNISQIEDVIAPETRERALASPNLYVVREWRNSLQVAPAFPKRLKTLVPQLKSSDFGFVIFDLPPVSQISMTPYIAKFMDIVLLVVESEKTDRDLVKRASALLGESQRHIGIVLNKARSYGTSDLEMSI